MVFQLNYCHVLYVIPGHWAERLKPISGGRGFLNLFLLDQKSRKPLHAGASVSKVSSGTAQAPQNEWGCSGGSRSGSWLPVFCLTSCAKFLGACTPSKPPRLHSACETLSPCSHVALQVVIPAWVTQNYTSLSRSTRFHSSFILGWVVSFLHHWVFQGKSSFVCK